MDNVKYLYYKYLNKYKEQIKTNNTLIVLKLIHLVYQLLFFVSIILLLFVKYDSKIHYYILGVWVIIIIHLRFTKRGMYNRFNRKENIE